MWDEITYSFPNFNGANVEVWELISNFNPMLEFKLIHVSKRGPCNIWPNRTRLNKNTLSRKRQQRTKVKVEKHGNSKSESMPNIHFTNGNFQSETLWYIRVDNFLQRINQIVKHTIKVMYLEIVFGINIIL